MIFPMFLCARCTYRRVALGFADSVIRKITWLRNLDGAPRDEHFRIRCAHHARIHRQNRVRDDSMLLTAQLTYLACTLADWISFFLRMQNYRELFTGTFDERNVCFRRQIFPVFFFIGYTLPGCLEVSLSIKSNDWWKLKIRLLNRVQQQFSH